MYESVCVCVWLCLCVYDLKCIAEFSNINGSDLLSVTESEVGRICVFSSTYHMLPSLSLSRPISFAEWCEIYQIIFFHYPYHHRHRFRAEPATSSRRLSYVSRARVIFLMV